MHHFAIAIILNENYTKPLAQANFPEHTPTHPQTGQKKKTKFNLPSFSFNLVFYKISVNCCCLLTFSTTFRSQHSVRHSYCSHSRHVRILDASLRIQLTIYSNFLFLTMTVSRWMVWYYSWDVVGCRRRKKTAKSIFCWFFYFSSIKGELRSDFFLLQTRAYLFSFFLPKLSWDILMSA